MAFTIGCDPEVFVRSSKEKQIVSAHGLVPGTKKAPERVRLGAIQVDGMALEFNTEPLEMRKGHEKYFSERVLIVMQALTNKLKEADPNLSLARGFATADFDPDYLASQPEEAKELGCDPDFNAYTGEPNPRPDGEVPFRTAAGHIHVGWGEGIPVDHPDHFEICRELVKVLDWYIGLPSVCLDRDSRRRLLYGKAGAFRPKSYGVEYRTPSNFWIFRAESREQIFKLVKRATDQLILSEGSSATLFRRYTSINPEKVREIIDTDDFYAAKSLVQNYIPLDAHWTEIISKATK